MGKPAKPIFGYAIKTQGILSATEVYDFTEEGRKDAIEYANRPAGQSVVKVRIIEVIPKRKLKP